MGSSGSVSSFSAALIDKWGQTPFPKKRGLTPFIDSVR